MKSLIIVIALFSSFFIYSCKVEPQNINYGIDHCLYCDMTVVDKRHAAQYVTKKGRAYMFDAVECLVGQILKESNADKLEFILVADYLNPGSLINAKKAVFLISENIKSPMGKNLSAFYTKDSAISTKIEYGGKLFSWEDLKLELSKN